MTRIGRRTVTTMLLIVAFTLLWNLLCHQSPHQSCLCDQTGSECLSLTGTRDAHHAPRRGDPAERYGPPPGSASCFCSSRFPS